MGDWTVAAPVATGSSSAPSSGARPLEQAAYAGSRGGRVNVEACVARRRADMKKTGKLKTLTHQAKAETLQRVQEVLAQQLQMPVAVVSPDLPLAHIGFVLEAGYVGLQHVAD